MKRSGRFWELILHISLTHELVGGLKGSRNDHPSTRRLMDVSPHDLYTSSRHGPENRDKSMFHVGMLGRGLNINKVY